MCDKVIEQITNGINPNFRKYSTPRSLAFLVGTSMLIGVKSGGVLVIGELSITYLNGADFKSIATPPTLFKCARARRTEPLAHDASNRWPLDARATLETPACEAARRLATRSAPARCSSASQVLRASVPLLSLPNSSRWNFLRALIWLGS